jgi:hypothetical protein
MGIFSILKRIYVAFLVALFLTLTAAAQKHDGFLGRFVAWKTAPDTTLSPQYIYQPKACFEVILTGDLKQTGVKLKSDINILSSQKPASDTDDFFEIGLEQRVYRETGLYFGWAGLNIGYSVELGRKSADKNTSLYLGYSSTYYGIKANYFDIKQKYEGLLSVYVDGFGTIDLDVNAEKPSRFRELIIDGYYAFNRHRYAYTAVYGGNEVQRRSSGSWMASGKYFYGKIMFDSLDAMTQEFLGNMRNMTAWQFSLGGGYGLNLVAWHRDAKDNGLKNLRNLTFNLTAMPQLTFLNRLNTTRHYEEWKTDADSQSKGELIRENDETEKVNGKVMLNYTATAGAVLSVDRFRFSVNGHFNHFRFRLRPAEHTERLWLSDNDEEDAKITCRTQTHGYFYNWGISTELHVRF